MRLNFNDQADALEKLGELQLAEAEEVAAPPPRLQRTDLDTDQLADARTAIKLAGDRPLTGEVATLKRLQKRANDLGITLDEALRFSAEHYRPNQYEITVFNARGKFLASRAKLTSKTQSHYRVVTKLLLKPDPNKLLHKFTLEDIEAILARYTNVNSRRTVRGGLKIFFRWAMKRRWILENPCELTDSPPKDLSHVAILDLDEVKRLLTAALNYRDGEMASVIAIGLFAGLRPSEIRDLQPSKVKAARIRVIGGKMRRKLRRSVPIPDNLAAWLKAHPFRGLPPGYERKMKILRKAAKAKNWKQDVIRHTSISFQLERDQDAAGVAFRNGTSERMVEVHYRDVIDDPKVVAAFWKLAPTAIKRAKLEVVLPEPRGRDWPTKTKLKKLVWSKPLSHLAKDLEISDVAIRKHCVKHGIELPSRGYWLREQASRKR